MKRIADTRAGGISADVAEWQTRYVQVVVHLVSVGSTPTVGTISSRRGAVCGEAGIA